MHELSGWRSVSFIFDPAKYLICVPRMDRKGVPLFFADHPDQKFVLDKDSPVWL
jgi:hypothetical protein